MPGIIVLLHDLTFTGFLLHALCALIKKKEFHTSRDSCSAQNDPYKCCLLQLQTLSGDKMVIKINVEHKRYNGKCNTAANKTRNEHYAQKRNITGADLVFFLYQIKMK